MTHEAEAWAESGTRKIDQTVLVPQPAGPPRHRRVETRITLDGPATGPRHLATRWPATAGLPPSRLRGTLAGRAEAL